MTNDDLIHILNCILTKEICKEVYTVEYEICKLDISDFDKCSNIWKMNEHKDLAKRFLSELQCGNRLTYIYKENGEFLGEISLVFDACDKDYTIKDKRIYLSRLVVKKQLRRKGIGRKLVEFIIEVAKNMGYNELSVGVDLCNYAALKLYTEYGFDKIVFVGEDGDGKFLKLLKVL
ncbi:GNAT family N-acetyltransferase [bacterium]|nr:GNAT family N-acetyltransferase [bacterium]